MQQDFCIKICSTHGLRHLRHGEPLPITKPENLEIARSERAGEVPDAFAFVLALGSGPRVGFIGRGVGFEFDHRAAFPVEGGCRASGDGEDPRSKRSLRIKSVNVSIGFHEGLLGQVLGVMRVSHLPKEKSVDPRPVAVEQFGEGLLVSSLTEFGQFLAGLGPLGGVEHVQSEMAPLVFSSSSGFGLDTGGAVRDSISRSTRSTG